MATANFATSLSAGGLSSASLEPTRLYQKIAKRLIEALQNGEFKVGDRMPAERDLAQQFGVSRPVVREAILALEVLGFIEVKVGSGAYVVRLSGKQGEEEFNVSAFELMEARTLFEGEAAALAATNITDPELDELERLVELIADANRKQEGAEDADHEFHMVIARATRNKAVQRVVEELWHLRSTSAECALLLEKARTANVQPVVEEHTAIVQALRSRDAGKARAAMRAHLSAVIDHLLFAIEEQAISKARMSVADQRERYSRASKL